MHRVWATCEVPWVVENNTGRRRDSNIGADSNGLPSSVATGSDMNFAQRLLMANELHVTNIADLWVASATAINTEDYEDPFESDDDDSSDEEIADDIPGIDIGKLPTIAKDDATVKRKLEKAKRKPVRSTANR